MNKEVYSVQGHVQKINYKIKIDAILMPIISNELKFNMELNGKGSLVGLQNVVI